MGKVGAHPASQDRATHEPSQSSLSRPTVGVPLREEACTHVFPERGVGCKLCEEYFAHRDKLDADPREMERQERLYQDIELKTLRTAMGQIRQIIKDTIGEELEL